MANSKEKKVKKNVPKKKEIIENKDKDKKISMKKEVIENKEESKTIPKKEEVIKNKEENKIIPKKKKKNTLINVLAFFITLGSLIYLVMTIVKEANLKDIITALLLLIFSILFVSISITNTSKKKGSNIWGLLVLLLIQLFFILTLTNTIKLPGPKVMKNFVNQKFDNVYKWAKDNNIEIESFYEYSEFIDKYKVIYQNIEPNKDLKDINKLIITISDGPNPYKEIIIPNMLGWNSDRVINYIKDNHLSNILVDFVSSEKDKDTLIDQSKFGNVRRNEEIKLIFSYGKERTNSEVKLNNLANKSLFEAIFYLKQQGIKYEISYEFSDRVPIKHVIGQDKEVGSMISLKDDVVHITVSKGNKIIIPEFRNLDLDEAIQWITKNKLKLGFKNEYDDTVKENTIIGSNYKKDDVVEEGTEIIITISKGQLKMPNFKELSDFRKWANENEIKYEEKHEFNDNVDIGKVISYSYKEGEVIKNGDTIIVTVSNGKKISVPNVYGLSENAAGKKIKNANLNYYCVYSYSNTKKGIVIKQSISAGASVSKGTTITITVSKGKAPTPPPKPVCDRSKGSALIFQAGNSGNETKTMISELNPHHKFNFVDVNSCPNGSTTPGEVCEQFNGQTRNYCDVITLHIIK